MAMEPMYRCSACSLGVIAIKKGDGESEEVTFIRGCRCEGAAIIGRMQATVVARGGTMSDGPARKPVLSDGAVQPPASMMGKWFALAGPGERPDEQAASSSAPADSEPAGG